MAEGGLEHPSRPHPTEEAILQFKIPTKRSQNRALYRKISIPFRKISDYGTSSEDGGIR